MKDPYDTLGVAKNATDAEIKKAYRQLSKKHHPDLNRDDKGAEAKFKEINAAYEILGDKQKRTQYDQYGAAGMGGHGGPGGDGGPGGFDFSGFQGAGSGFADIFETFFGGAGQGGGRRQRNYRGQDLEVRLSIKFEEAVFGVDKIISVNKDVKCDDCEGKGVEKGSKVVDCDECRGTGEVNTVKNTILGPIRTASVCSKCKGDGQIAEKPCARCHGNGALRSSENVTIRVPAGVSDGTTLRLSGKGGAGLKGHEAGDLYVHIRANPSKEFERKGDNIYTKKTIHNLQAILGDEVEVNTVHGVVRLEIPAGTQPGQTFRIRGKGVPRLNSTAVGDHMVTIDVEIPKKLMGSEKEHYEELARLAKLSTKSKDKGFFSGLFS